MSQKPLPKIYDRPERKMLSSVFVAIIAILLIIGGCLMTYRMMHPAAAAEVPSLPPTAASAARHAPTAAKAIDAGTRGAAN